MGACLWLLTRVVEVSSSVAARWPWAALTLGAPGHAAVALYYLGGLILVAGRGRRRIAGAPLVFMALALICAPAPWGRSGDRAWHHLH